jgi:hypothetical protein
MWFYQDDFGWLHLLPVHGFQGLLEALFLPKAHGNIRPFSENGFFMLFSWIFGMNPAPFRAAVFAAAIADLVLMGAVVRKLTGSGLAALGTQIFWLANSCVAVAFCWTSIYNQTQSLFFLLLAFWLLLRGNFKWQWIVFAIGLGSLETNVVYPALATLYALLFAREQVRKILPMFLLSAAFTAVHLWLAPVEKSGVYALHFDAGMLSTLWTYFRLAIGPERLAHFAAIPAWPATAVLTIALLAAAVRLGRLGLFAAGWFVIALSPLLPLRDHVSDYYLAAPMFGLAMLGGAAIAKLRKPLAFPIAALYLAISLPAAWMVTTWHYERSQAVKNLVLGVVEIHEHTPGKAILLRGVGSDLFMAGVADLPFELYGIRDVYLTPGTEGRLQQRYALPLDKTREMLDAGKAVVYDASGPVLRNVTSLYRQSLNRIY